MKPRSAGAVLVAETWPAEHRVKAVGFMQSGWALGYMLAAGVTALILPRFGWRVLFLTGLLPALVAIAVRHGVPEPEIWTKMERKPISLGALFAPGLMKRTILATALTTSVLFAYWGLFTWMPGYLSSPKEAGGAGLSVLKTSAWIIPMQLGAFFGYNSFGWIADRFGRRPAFVTYMLASAALVPIYGTAHSETTLLWLGPFVGFFGSGYFSLFADAMLAELLSHRDPRHGPRLHLQFRTRTERTGAPGHRLNGGQTRNRARARDQFGLLPAGRHPDLYPPGVKSRTRGIVSESKMGLVNS